MRCIFKTGLMGFLCFAWIMSANIAHSQQSYRVEISPMYAFSEDDDDTEEKRYGLGLTYHFAPVNVGKHPLAEAAFMERIGNFSMVGGVTEVDFGSGIEADGPIYGMQLLYAQPAQPIVAQVYFTKAEADFDDPIEAEISTKAYGLGIGAYLRDGLLVTLNYERSEADLSATGVSVFETEHDIFEIDVKWVNELANNRAINLFGGVEIDQFDRETDDGSNTTFGIAADYYLTSYISLGGSLALNTGDDEDEEGKSIGGRFRAFLHPQFSIEGAYEHFSADNRDAEDEESVEITLAVRFQ